MLKSGFICYFFQLNIWCIVQWQFVYILLWKVWSIKKTEIQIKDQPFLVFCMNARAC